MNSMGGNKPKNYIVETALLGQGLISIEDEKILSVWPKDALLAWIQKGKIKIGTIEEFIPARRESNNWQRLDGITVKNKRQDDVNAYLTASGTMVVAKAIGCPMVVSAGIGGIGDIKDEKLCYDLPALSKLGITLVATSPKDMLDIPGTLNWLNNHEVRVLGYNTNICNGYILVQEATELRGQINSQNANKLEYGNNLILNPIPEKNRLQDLSLLKEAIKAGKEAENQGGIYHPAANACFDRLSLGLSSKIQLESLISNIEVAKLISKNR
ncbi:MAG: hypothetical protein GX981_03365 [Tissierellia bacterium]|nr:hypothetical protein [Tissierellia bacterium]